MKPIGMLLLVLVLIAATALPAISQEAPAPQGTQPPVPPPTPEQPGVRLQIRPEGTEAVSPPETTVCLPAVTIEPEPAPCPQPLPEYADYPLYWAGAVLYPVGVALENIFVRPFLSVFNHRFEEPWETTGYNASTPGCNGGTQVSACPSPACPVGEQQSTSPKYNFQPHKSEVLPEEGTQ